ncbi:MAG: hypothetical protein ABIL16_02210 [candidate division WOR-3 bacterium]
MEYTFETTTRVLVLDERVYKGKSRMYLCASEDLGLIRVVGKGLYMLGTFEVYIKKSRTLYYLEEAKPIYDYRHVLRNPVVVEAYSKIFSTLDGLEGEKENLYAPLLTVLDKLEREPSNVSQKISQLLKEAKDDPKRLINELLLI